MKKWIARNGNAALGAPEAAPAPGIPLPVALVLARRGHDPSSLRRFLDPKIEDLTHWSSIPGMAEAAGVLSDAAAGRSRILVWGDFDADGLTAAAIMHNSLKAAGASCSIHIPDRMEDGYGLGEKAVEIAGSHGADLLVTVDCGINACAEVAALEAAGIRTVVTDHHEPGDTLPPASAIVDPCMHGGGEPWSMMSGSGTAFVLGRAIAEITGTPGPDDSSLALACVGTICDVVPLMGDNRIIARLGLGMLRKGSVPGLAALCSKAGFEFSDASGFDVSFRLGPRLNSCGRIANAGLAIDLLLSETFDDAVGAAAEMERHNDARRLLDRKVFEEASRLAVPFADAPALVLASTSWHKGVIGIAASRLVSEINKPVILCSIDRDGKARGSARGVPGINLYEILGTMKEMLGAFGGHAGAAGLEFRADMLDTLRERFCAEAAARLGPEPRSESILLDGRLCEEDLTEGLARELTRLEPFGEGNQEPVWITSDARTLEWSTVGGGKHLNCSFAVGGRKLKAIGFGLGGMDHPGHSPQDLAYCLRMDEFRGRRELRLHLRDIRPTRRTDGHS